MSVSEREPIPESDGPEVEGRKGENNQFTRLARRRSVETAIVRALYGMLGHHLSVMEDVHTIYDTR